ncbi:MAG: carbohydrate binding family 9 domain-containing protein [Candidatus Latescibacteria bacterium]|nr:carbohydrate binding family 9 domain-containing protein [Candidatus Latescibacterota bacterium]
MKNSKGDFVSQNIMAICIILASLYFSGNVFAQVKPLYITDNIRLDGSLSDDAWKAAEPVSGFTQMELVEGDPASEKTEVRVLYNENTIYIGFMCYDSDPSGIIAKQLKRDGGQGSDDYVEVVFDTYHDMRTGFGFEVNPNGARFDASFRSGNSETSNINTEWDAIWDARSVITAEGWSTEIAIPFKSLRFPTSDVQTWGINFKRTIRRKNEITLWRGWKRNQGIWLLSQAGTMTIDKSIGRSRGIDVKPYILAGVEKEKGKEIDDLTKVGLDLKYSITSNMILDLTTNTDFAHIESDREVINLSRFDIYYPEKREFFLEGSDTFDFTQGGTRLFYSRTIGITPSRENQRILGGAKLTQKAGSYRLGVLTMQTEEQSGYPGANYSIVRAKKDILEQSYVGFLATNKVDEDKHDNQVVGVDWILRTDKFLGDRNLDVQGYLSGSMTDGHMHESSAGRLYISYPNDFISSFILYHALDEQFNPEMGFARTVGIKNYIWFTTLQPRPDIPFIKKLVLKPFNFNYTTDMDGVLLFRDIEIRPLGFVTDSDDEFSFSINNDYDFIYETDFSIFGTAINQGIYNNWNYNMSFSSSSQRNISVSLSGLAGDFFSGTRNGFSSAVTYKSGRRYSFTADAEYTKLDLAGTKITARDYGTRVGIDFSTRLSTSTFLQYNNETRKVNMNFRLRFIPKAGSDLYLVYNHLMDESDRYRTLRNAAILKMDYIFRF